MPDVTPPPRRPAPDRLRDEIARALDDAPRRQLRWRTVFVPVAAASVIGATIFGISTLGDRQTVVPSNTASPYPATATPTLPTTSPTSAASQPANPPQLDIRPMTKAEIAADTRSCRQRPDPDDDLPRPKSVDTQYAMVQLRAGIDGPLSGPVRVLLLRDSAGSWVCEDGANTSWSANDRNEDKPTIKVPVLEVPNFGGFSATCSEQPKVTGDELFAVGDAVVTGRMRLVVGSDAGPWQTVEPAAGLIHFLFSVVGSNAESRAVSTEYQFLDQRGRRLTIQPYGERGTPTTTSVKTPVSTCAEVRDRMPKPKPVKRPATDQAGVAACLAKIKDQADEQELPFRRTRWSARLTVSTPQEWGAVLSDGQHRVGCSLFPTVEITRLVADTATVRESAFYFALNPIGVSGGESLWAAGRVPEDVTALSYRLPGNRLVAATINAQGYWMVKDHRAEPGYGEENVDQWPPVVVSITRPSGTQTFTLKFTEKTMCNQDSHGC